jgi:ribosomal protein L7/L12
MSDVVTATAAGATLGLVLVMFWHVLTARTEVTSMQRKLDALLKHAGVDFKAEAEGQARALLQAGNKIEAIKVYREMTGAGLAEAKAAVERL